jgi:hypothetical protein
LRDESESGDNAMNKWHILYHLARADFLERIRRYSFLLTLGLTVYVGFTFVPAVDASYVTVALGAYRGVYNSAWIGSMVALMTAVFLSLPGFYLVNNAIDRDRQTGVGHIIAATPITKRFYTLGKAISNFSVLSIIVGVLALEAVVMLIIRGEELSVNPWALLTPFVFIVLPAMAVVAALATLFETVSWLRSGLGNAIYLFLWLGLILLGMVTVLSNVQRINLSAIDALGFSVPLASMSAACKAVFPDYNGIVNLGYEGKTIEGSLTTFRWDGVNWTLGIFLGRLLWVSMAAAIVLMAASFFDRFDPARKSRRGRNYTEPPLVNAELKAASPARAQVQLTPLLSSPTHFSLGRMLYAELRLMLKGVRRWWYVVIAGLIIASVFTPLDIVRHWLLPAVWIWPLLIWSAMGTRETRHRTTQFVFSSAHPVRRQLFATLLAGVVVALLAASGVLVRLILTGNWIGVLALVVGALFIPSLAFTLGVYAGSSKLFEVIYMLVWYSGPVNKVPVLDFTGSSINSGSARMPLIYLICTVVLVALAVIGRQRQIRN